MQAPPLPPGPGTQRPPLRTYPAFALANFFASYIFYNFFNIHLSLLGTSYRQFSGAFRHKASQYIRLSFYISVVYPHDVIAGNAIHKLSPFSDETRIAVIFIVLSQLKGFI